MALFFRFSVSFFAILWVESFVLRVFGGDPSSCGSDVKGLRANSGPTQTTEELVSRAHHQATLDHYEAVLGELPVLNGFINQVRALKESQLWVDSGTAPRDLYRSFIDRRKKRANPDIPSFVSISKTNPGRKPDGFFWQNIKIFNEDFDTDKVIDKWLQEFEYVHLYTDLHGKGGLISQTVHFDRVLRFYLETLQTGGSLYFTIDPKTIFIENARRQFVPLLDYLKLIKGVEIATTQFPSPDGAGSTIVVRLTKSTSFDDEIKVPTLSKGQTVILKGKTHYAYRLTKEQSALSKTFSLALQL